jgi:hypothetical protein
MHSFLFFFLPFFVLLSFFECLFQKMPQIIPCVFSSLVLFFQNYFSSLFFLYSVISNTFFYRMPPIMLFTLFVLILQKFSFMFFLELFSFCFCLLYLRAAWMRRDTLPNFSFLLHITFRLYTTFGRAYKGFAQQSPPAQMWRRKTPQRA